MDEDLSGKERLSYAALSMVSMLGAFTLWGGLILLSPALLSRALRGLESKKLLLFSWLWGSLFAALFHLWSLSRGSSFWMTLIGVRGVPWLAYGISLWLFKRVPSRHPLQCLVTGVSLAAVSQSLLITGSGFDWECPVAALANWPFCLALLPWVGLTGSAFLLGTCSHLLLSTQKRERIAGLLSLSILGLVSGLVHSWRVPPKTMPALKLALLQTGWTEAQKWDPRYVEVSKDRLVELSLEAKGSDLIIWPETAWPVRRMRRQHKDRVIISRLAQLAEADLLVSSVEIEEGDWLNTVTQVNSDGVFGEQYTKQRLIPYGEYIPLPQFARARIVDLKPRDPEDRLFISGDRGVLFETKGWKYSSLVCYDSLVPWPTAKVADSIDFLVIVTNDAPLSWEFPKEAHFRSAILRAAEFQLPIFQASNNGITGVIDPRGKVLKRVEPGDKGAQVLFFKNSNGSP